MEIRQIQESDIIKLAGFEREISIISFGAEAITDEAFHAGKIRKGFEKNRDGMLVLIIGGQVEGWLWMDAKSNFLTQETYINFRSFYISEAHRGGSGGSLLMEAGLDYCKQIGATSVVGKTHTENLAMRALYKQFGFKATHITFDLSL